MRDFGLEVFFSKWEFTAKHHMTASDVESMSMQDLLGLASDEDRAAFEGQWLGYTQTWGAPDLNAEIADTYDRMKAENILCFAGAGEGIYTVMKVLLTADDHIIVPVPNYQSAETVPLGICAVTGVRMKNRAMEAGASGHDMANNSAADWRLELDDIKAAVRPNTKVISLNFPHNPTGVVMPREDLDALVIFCRERGIYIFSDEVYRGIETNPAHQLPQIADIYELGISLNVMSKAYGLPGLRIGWIASPALDVLQKCERYKHYLSICNSAPSEQLALIALRARTKILARNTDLVRGNLELLEALFADFPGLIDWHRPMGGCVAFPKFNGGEGGEEFCRKLIEESGVLLLPSSIYESDIQDVPPDHFRIGFGRDKVVKDGIAAMRLHFEKHYSSFAR
jgi:aspartate/methionine/tyrosine aminotransferase